MGNDRIGVIGKALMNFLEACANALSINPDVRGCSGSLLSEEEQSEIKYATHIVDAESLVIWSIELPQHGNIRIVNLTHSTIDLCGGISVDSPFRKLTTVELKSSPSRITKGNAPFNLLQVRWSMTQVGRAAYRTARELVSDERTVVLCDEFFLRSLIDDELETDYFVLPVECQKEECSLFRTDMFGVLPFQE